MKQAIQVSVLILCTMQLHANPMGGIHQSLQDISNSPLSFLTGLVSGIVGGSIQRSIIYSSVNRGKHGFLNIYYPQDYDHAPPHESSLAQKAEQSYNTSQSACYGSLAGACAGGFATDTILTTIFSRFGTDFWRHVAHTDDRIVEKGFSYGKNLLSATIALWVFSQDSNRVSNQILCNELGTIASATCNLEHNLRGGISLRYNIID